jgi:hypothetical protein
MLGIPLHGSTIAGITVGSLFLFTPRFVLEGFTAHDWEIGVLRFVGFATAALGLLWEGTRPMLGRTLGRAQRRALIAWILVAIFFVGNTSLMLIFGFSLLMAAALEMSMERALAYSDLLRRRVYPPHRSPPTE